MRTDRRMFAGAAIAMVAAILSGCGSGTSTPPPAISISFPGGSSQTIMAGQSVSITVNVSNDSSGRGVTWKLTGPGALSKQTSTSVEYDSPVSVASNATATVTATAVADPSKSASDTVTITPGPLTLVSGDSPFPVGCAASQNTTDHNYVNAEVEPFLAVNPANVNNLIGVWQQDRWQRDGSAAGILTGTSHDSGKTWTHTFAHFSLCSGGTAGNGGDYERASDPWVSIGPDGIAYQITVSGDRSTARRATLVSRSTDGGNTWSEPTVLVADNFPSPLGPLVVEDKTSITADPTRPGFAYAAWSRFYTQVTPQDDGPFTFSRTTDGGVTWEPWRNIYDPGRDAGVQTQGFVVLPNGTLIAMFLSFFQNQFSAAILRSTDASVTWSQPIIISAIQNIGVIDVKTNEKVRTGQFSPSLAVDRATGTLYVAWQDSRFSSNQRDGIVFSKSSDGGLTWSLPVQVNQAPNVQAFTPTVDVASDGKVAVTYFDFRKDTADASVLLTNYWQITSSDGGNTWQEIPLAGPFDMRTAPKSGGFFVGDYEGLAHAGATFWPFFAMANSGNASNPTDIFMFNPNVAATTASTADTATNGHVEINTQPQSLRERLQIFRQRQPPDRQE